MRAVRRYTTREIVCARLAPYLATLRPPVLPTPPPARRLFLPTHLGAYFVAIKICHCRPPRGASRSHSHPCRSATRSAPLLELPLPLPADLGELDLLAPVLCAFPLELELELELGCAESWRSSPASADGRLGRLPGIFGRLGVNFDVEFAPGAAPTLAARCSPAPALARKMEIPVLEAPVPALRAEENDAPTALRSAAAASGTQLRAPTVTHSSAGSSLARRGSSRSAWGWWRGYGCCTAWRFVGKYLHWNPRIEELARAYLRRAFGVAPGAPLPPPVDECFAPLSTYARRVEEVREELQRTRAIEVQRVVLTSDETNATWEEVAAYGWHRVDHSTTAARPREGGAKEVGGGEQRRAKPRLGYSERIMVPFELRGVPRRPKAGGRRRATSGVVEAEAARCGAAPHVVGARQC
ncbi:hypothetical protein B0H14DRAFT_3880429 [Mycena olivaceomarginata]|nr:hypothetical protein B0H14DRAFT_3880429 [Mycena olivaceomarginata]